VKIAQILAIAQMENAISFLVRRKNIFEDNIVWVKQTLFTHERSQST